MLSITCVDDFLNKAFFKIGLIVGRHPGYFVIVPVLLACICLTGYQQITYEIDPEYLFSPLNGPGKTERAIVEEHFKVNYSDKFSIARITRPGRFGHVVILSKDNDTNLLRSAIFNELIILDQVIRNATATYDGETYTYAKICAKWLGECFTNDILELDEIIEDVENKEMNLTFPISFNPVTWTPHLIPVYFGGSVVGEDMVLESAPALQLGYFVVVDNPKQNAIGAAWEEAFLDAVGKAEDGGLFKHISVARFASRTLELEFEANTQTVIPYYFSTFTIMALFSVVTCMMADWVRSKPWLGLLGNVSAGMATTAAFGLCCYLGVDFIGINLAAPFLMIGIGIDDTFVMLAAWRRTNIMDPVPQRMAHTLSEAAVSITITSVTDMVSFFIGIISPFPSVQIFCIYSGFAVVFTFVFHLTFFAGCVAISGYCEQKNLHSVVCCPVQPLSKSEHRSWFYRMFCTGGLDPADPNNPIDNPEHGCMSWFRDYLAAALNKPTVKIAVVLIFGLYLAGGLYGLTTLKEGLDRRRLSKSDSYSITFYDREDTYYREFPYRIQTNEQWGNSLVFTDIWQWYVQHKRDFHLADWAIIYVFRSNVVISGQYDYSDPIVQEQMENLTLSLEATKWIGGGVYTESWLRSFIAYYEEHRDDEDFVNYKISNESSFIGTLVDTWLYPTSTWALDVKLDNKSEHIVASRFLIQAVNVSGTNNEKDMVRELRQICQDSPLNATVFHPYFVFFDQFELVMPTSIQCLTYGALTMMVISFIFIPNVLCSLWVAFCIVSIEIGVAGYMALWDVSLDSISMINLIMCIGFSVDFTAHICYSYMSSKHKRPEDRVKECLYTLGLPIVQGSLSTIIGLFALVLANTYIFLVFFKMVFLVIFLGALHGLFLLPVLLSVFGPGSCTNFEREEQLQKTKEIAKLSKPYVIPHPTLFYGKGKDASPGVSIVALEDKDLGLGTSEDSNSTESGSSQSRRKDRQTEQDYRNKSHYQDWRRSLGMLQSLSQLQTTSAPPPDYPGARASDERRDVNPRNVGFLYNTNRLPPTRIHNNRQDSRRSRSQQNLNQSPARYLNDPKYP